MSDNQAQVPVAPAETKPQPTKVDHKWLDLLRLIGGLLVSLVIGAYGAYLKLSGMHQEALAKAVAAGKKDTQDVKNSMLIGIDDMRVIQEQSKHTGDDPPDGQQMTKVNFGADGSVTLHRFFRDGCIQIVRKSPNPGAAPESKWMFGSQAAAPSAVQKSGVVLKNDTNVTLGFKPADSTASQKPPSFQETLLKGNSHAHMRLTQFGGRCIDPHPGPFTFQNQQINQCIVQQTRYFSDGCVHTQLFNACNGSWDVYPNGAPHVNWIRCVHP